MELSSSSSSLPVSNYVCLSSRVNLDVFPDNTDNSFVNQLPVVLRNRANKRFYIRLKAVGVTTDGVEESRTSSYLKVHISEVESQRKGVVSDHCIGGLPFPPAKCADNYGLHVFQRAPHLPIRFQELHALHVRLTDERDEPVVLPAGSATLIWVEITEMIRNDDEFTITCVSSQPDHFPNNTLSQFVTPLPQEMNLRDYEVALSQLIYPPQMRERAPAWLRIDRRTWRWDLSNLLNADDFINRVIQRIRRSRYGKFIILTQTRAGPHKGHVFLARRQAGANLWKGGIEIEFSETFSAVMGDAINPVTRLKLMPGETHKFNGKPNLRLGLPHPVAMLQSDIITPNILSGKMSRLLQCVPILRQRYHNDERLYEPPQRAFHALPSHPISRIGFRFTQLDGQTRQFISDKPDQSIVITLLFRRRRRY